MVGQLARELLQAAKEHVRTDGSPCGESERRRADVGRQLDGRRPRLLPRLDFEAPPIGRDAHVQVELAHHLGRQRDVRPLVELALDLDDGPFARKRREQQQPGDPLRERARE